MKKFKGFTLIELIVVIAIIGVLAAMLVPAMMGWVYKSRIGTYNGNAREVYGQFQVILTDRIASGDDSIYNGTVEYKNHSFSSADISITDDMQKELLKFNNSMTDMSSVTWAAEIVDGQIVGIAFSGNDCKAVGGYPEPCPSTMDRTIVISSVKECLKYADGSEDWPIR